MRLRWTLGGRLRCPQFRFGHLPSPALAPSSSASSRLGG